MATMKSPLTDDARKATGEVLQGALVDLIDLSLQAKQAHWNLTGKQFRSLHLQLDEIVTMARTHTDTVAERASAIGIPPDGRVGTISAKAAGPHVDAGWLADDKVIAAFCDILGGISARLRERIATVQQVDPVTENIFEDIVHDIEKNLWMVQAMQ